MMNPLVKARVRITAVKSVADAVVVRVDSMVGVIWATMFARVYMKRRGTPINALQGRVEGNTNPQPANSHFQGARKVCQNERLLLDYSLSRYKVV